MNLTPNETELAGAIIAFAQEDWSSFCSRICDDLEFKPSEIIALCEKFDEECDTADAPTEEDFE